MTPRIVVHENIYLFSCNNLYCNNLPIIVSCEKGVEELLDIDEAVGSRLIEMSKGSIVELKGRKLNYRVYRTERNMLAEVMIFGNFFNSVYDIIKFVTAELCEVNFIRK